MNPPLHPSQEGNLQPVLQTKLPSSEGPGVGSWRVPVGDDVRESGLWEEVGLITSSPTIKMRTTARWALGVFRFLIALIRTSIPSV
jgi:hypothetical protein